MGSAGSIADDARPDGSLSSILQRKMQEACDAGAIEAAINDMKEKPEDPNVQQVSCSFLISAIEGYDDDEKVLERRKKAKEAKALESVLQAIHGHPEVAAVQLQAAMALHQLLYTEDYPPDGVLKAVTTALKQSRDTIVIKKHLKILEEFFCPVDDYWQQFVEEKIFDAFINIFQNGNEAAIVGVSRQLTPFISYEPKRQEAAGKSGMAEAISEALEKHKSFKVLRDVCALLFYWPGMKGISEDSRAKIITTIAKTGMKHMEIIEKEAAAVDILSGIASVISYDRDYDEKESEEVVKNQEIAFKSGMLDLALALMEKSEDLMVFDYGGRIFGRICSDEERKDQAVKIKAIDLFAKGMKRAEDDQSEVLEHITFALMKICGENEARTKLLKEAQVTPEQLRKTDNYYGLHQDQQHLEGLENLAKQLEALG